MMRTSTPLALLMAVSLAMGCKRTPDTNTDTGAHDTGSTDTGTHDTSATDTSTTDTSTADTGTTDTGTTDTATDTGTTDTGDTGATSYDSIVDIQTHTIAIGSTVTVKGVVTALYYDNASFWLQESGTSPEYTGIYVYNNGNDVGTLKLGDEVVVHGTTDEFPQDTGDTGLGAHTKTEITASSITFQQAGTEPTPADVSIDTFAGDPEPYEGVLIKVAGLDVSVGTDGYAITTVQNGLTIDDNTGPFYVLPAGSTLDVTGVLDFRYDTWTLEPRTLSDFENVVLPTPKVDATVFFNEIHYDNTGSPDSNEGFEIAGPQGTDLTGWVVYEYRGDGTVYSQGPFDLSGTLTRVGSTNYGVKWFGLDPDSLGNSTQGLVLVDDTQTVRQFISWEGAITATADPSPDTGTVSVTGTTSDQIGSMENGGTADSESMQLKGCGNSYADFTWEIHPIASTHDAVNTNQTFSDSCP